MRRLKAVATSKSKRALGSAATTSSIPVVKTTIYSRIIHFVIIILVGLEFIPIVGRVHCEGTSGS